KDGKTVLAATPRGVFRSTDAARATWKQTLTEPVADVKYHPTDTKRAVAGGLDTGRAFYTTDGGQSWKPAAPADAWSGRVELTYARRDPSIVYASVQMLHGEIWRSTDGGRTFARRSALNPDG